MKTVRNKTVLITGASSGLGKNLAQELLKKGAKVAATFRKQDQIIDFEKENPEALGVLMDITDTQMIEKGVAKVIERFGTIDILANNAGVGAIGAVEETSEEETQKIFEINFFGGLRLIRSVIPLMRNQHSGHIVLFSAIGGFHGVPGFGLYASAKGATQILGESLSIELKGFGVDVTILTIGLFDTGMATRVLWSKNQIQSYENTPTADFKQMIRQLPGKEPNDPNKAAHAIIAILESENPPLHTALGADALSGMRKKMHDLEIELKVWEVNASSTSKNQR
ncbi:MAG: SDR family NAD(P)-dependent oxidoreductase [Flavobacteriaceae bacterium]|nr:SDR family NAD(P)-dependent oxidoreductase [Flavobacteriaceae bacterium]